MQLSIKLKYLVPGSVDCILWKTAGITVAANASRIFSLEVRRIPFKLIPRVFIPAFVEVHSMLKADCNNLPCSQYYRVKELDKFFALVISEKHIPFGHIFRLPPVYILDKGLCFSGPAIFLRLKPCRFPRAHVPHLKLKQGKSNACNQGRQTQPVVD